MNEEQQYEYDYFKEEFNKALDEYYNTNDELEFE